MSDEEDFYRHSMDNLEMAQSVLSTCLQSITEDIEMLSHNWAKGLECDCEKLQVLTAHTGLFKIHLKETLAKVQQIGTDIRG